LAFSHARDTNQALASGVIVGSLPGSIALLGEDHD